MTDTALASALEEQRASALAVARRVLAGSGLEPDDVVQDAFVKVLLAARDGRAPADLPRAWVLTVVRNTAVDARRRARPSVPLDGHDVAGPSVLDLAVARDELGQVLADVRRLPDEQRRVLVAAAAEAAPSAAAPVRERALLHRARRNLRFDRTARETPCHEVRARVGDARSRGVRPDELSRRHLRGCAGCRAHAAALGGRRARGLLGLPVVVWLKPALAAVVAGAGAYEATELLRGTPTVTVQTAAGAREVVCDDACLPRAGASDWRERWTGLDRLVRRAGASSGVVEQTEVCRPVRGCITVADLPPSGLRPGSTVEDDVVVTVRTRFGVRGGRLPRAVDLGEDTVALRERHRDLPDGGAEAIAERGAACAVRTGRCRPLSLRRARVLAQDPARGAPGVVYAHQLRVARFGATANRPGATPR